MLRTSRSTAFIGALVGSTAWGLGYALTLILGQGLAAVNAYAVVVGWWLTAYVAAVLDIPVLSAAILACFYLIIFVFAAFTKHTWFYRDIESLTAAAVFGVGSVQAIMIAAPIIFNWVIRRFLIRLLGSYFIEAKTVTRNPE